MGPISAVMKGLMLQKVSMQFQLLVYDTKGNIVIVYERGIWSISLIARLHKQIHVHKIDYKTTDIRKKHPNTCG